MASKTRENYFAQYKSSQKWKANREAKLLRQLKLQPGNSEQIEAAIGNLVYRRQTPLQLVADQLLMMKLKRITLVKLCAELIGPVEPRVA